MSAIREISCVHYLTDGNAGPVTAIQDHFGSAYRCLPRPVSPGTIYQTNFHQEKTYKSREGDPEMKLVCLILRRAHLNTVKALWRRLGTDIPLRKGFWYEVRGE